MERTFAASEVLEPNVLWVVAGVPVSNIQPARLTIGQVSDGHPAIHRGVNLACTATGDVDIGMTICMGESFKHKNPTGEERRTTAHPRLQRAQMAWAREEFDPSVRLETTEETKRRITGPTSHDV